MEAQAHPMVTRGQTEVGRGNGEAVVAAVASVENDQRNIEMSFANAVPFQISVGCIMTTPIVILLNQGVCSSVAMNDVWVFVSLIDADSELSVGDELLQGRRADNAHSVSGSTTQMKSSLAYASFPDLVISRPGRFKLRITAIDMR